MCRIIPGFPLIKVSVFGTSPLMGYLLAHILFPELLVPSLCSFAQLASSSLSPSSSW